MAKSQSEKDKQYAQSKYDQGFRPMLIWVLPEHKPEAKRMELEVWRTPIVKDKIN